MQRITCSAVELEVAFPVLLDSEKRRRRVSAMALLLCCFDSHTVRHYLGYVAGPLQDHGDQFLVCFLVTLLYGLLNILALARNLQEDSLNFVGCLVLFVTSLPSVTNDTAKITGLALSLFLLGMGNGGVKAVVSPFIGDQRYCLTLREHFFCLLQQLYYVTERDRNSHHKLCDCRKSTHTTRW